MKTQVITLLAALVCAASARAESPRVAEHTDADRQWAAEHGLIGTFIDGHRTIQEGKTYTVRGVVNIVHLPIADGDQHGTEQGSVTGGCFFLFTPERYTFKGRGNEDKPVQIKEQQMFHLVLDDDEVAKVEAALGKPVEMEVQPFLRTTMYHHTPVLFHVSSFKVIEGAATRPSPAAPDLDRTEEASPKPSPSPSPT
jgi:hypothetical protein